MTTEYTIKILDLANGDTIIGQVKTNLGSNLIYVDNPALMLVEMNFDDNKDPLKPIHYYQTYIPYSLRKGFTFNPNSIISISLPYGDIEKSYNKFLSLTKSNVEPIMEDEFNEQFDEITKPEVKPKLH